MGASGGGEYSFMDVDGEEGREGRGVRRLQERQHEAAGRRSRSDDGGENGHISRGEGKDARTALLLGQLYSAFGCTEQSPYAGE